MPFMGGRFRVVESLLLIFGGKSDTELPKLASAMKLNTFQLSMVALGIGSTLLNCSFFRSRVIPHWLSLGGMVGYGCLFFGAVLSLLGILGAAAQLSRCCTFQGDFGSCLCSRSGCL
jgi:hypothetical protein